MEPQVAVKSDPSAMSFLSAGGEMGAAMRAHDWSTSPLGNPHTWPASLKTAVALMINSRHPMFIAWGPQLAFLYNDGYIPIFGRKHPHTLGLPFHEVWSEIWDDIKPLIDRALSGQPTWSDNLHLVMERNGYPEDTWYSFSYSPVRDESGRIAGMFCACTETTGQVLAQRRQQYLLELESSLRNAGSARDALDVACAAIGRELGAVLVTFNEFDDGAEYVTVTNEWRAGNTRSAIGRHPVADYGAARLSDLLSGAPEVVEDLAEDPRTAGGAAEASYAVLGCRASLNVPLVHAGRVRAMLAIGVANRRRWSAHEVALAQETVDRTWQTAQRARAEEALRERAEELQTVLDAVPAAIWIARDPEGRNIVGNRASYSLLRLRAGSNASLSAAERPAGFRIFKDGRELAPGDLPVQRAAASGAVVEHFEEEVRFDDGASVTLYGNAAPLRDATGQVRGAVAAFVDISAAKQAQQALIESEERFRNMADHAPTMMWVTDPDGCCTYLNLAWQQFTGQTEAEGKGFGWLEAVHPEDRGWSGERFLAAHAEREAFRLEYRLRRHDGAYRWAIDAAAPRFAANGEFLGYVGSVIDIDERRELEERRRNSEERLRTLTNALPAFVWFAGPDGKLHYFNDRWYSYSGQTTNEALPDGWRRTLHPDDVQRTAERWAEATATGAVYEMEMRYRRADGVYRWHVARAEPLRDDQGEINIWVGTSTDIHDRREAEDRLAERVALVVAEREAAQAQLFEAQKMETIGQLTGGIAHDFNNLLTPIIGGLDILRRKLTGDERTVRVIAGAQQAAERSQTLISRLLTFARRQHLDPRPVDIVALLQGLEELIARSIGPQTTVRLELAADLPAATVDPNQLELAILNLAVNARDAMPGGGVLTVRARLADPGETEGLRLQSDRYVRIDVQDTGCGMDPETLRRAVEPFYSTKGVGKGTGLGLSMVHGLAAQSGGALALRSAPGSGTTATLYLPAALQAASSQPITFEEPLIESRPLNILLVDDEELVRLGAADMLADLGHRVRQASSGVEALEILRREPGLDLLITDYVMPSMTGPQLIRQAQMIDAKLRALLITGYAAVAEDLSIPRLSKPFRQRDLAAAIAELFESKVIPLSRDHRNSSPAGS
jgi:PAS domain S-box-containing protein